MSKGKTGNGITGNVIEENGSVVVTGSWPEIGANMREAADARQAVAGSFCSDDIDRDRSRRPSPDLEVPDDLLSPILLRIRQDWSVGGGGDNACGVESVRSSCCGDRGRQQPNEAAELKGWKTMVADERCREGAVVDDVDSQSLRHR